MALPLVLRAKGGLAAIASEGADEGACVRREDVFGKGGGRGEGLDALWICTADGVSGV